MSKKWIGKKGSNFVNQQLQLYYLRRFLKTVTLYFWNWLLDLVNKNAIQNIIIRSTARHCTKFF